MTDRLIATSQELRQEGEDLSSEIERHGAAFYERLCRMEARLQNELIALNHLKRKFEWSVPKQNTAGQLAGLAGPEQRIRAVEANKDRVP